MAFCGLYTDLESLNGLDRPGRSLLAVAASRMAFHANLRTSAINCSQNAIHGNRGHFKILNTASKKSLTQEMLFNSTTNNQFYL